MDLATYTGFDWLQTIAVFYASAVTVASHLINWLPTPVEIKSHRYLIFYNTVRRIARSKPWNPDRNRKQKAKAITAAKKSLDTAKEKVKEIEVIDAQDDKKSKRKEKP